MKNIGVIGLGRRSNITQYCMRPDDGFQVVAGADPHAQAVTEYKNKHAIDIDGYSHYTELVARTDIDAVFVCSPDHLHEEHVCAALRAGKDVYTEKPLAIAVSSCDRILQVAAESGQILYVGHNMRHFPVIKKMKEIIDSGRIGEVQAAWCRHFVSYGGDAYYKDWHAERQYVNGLLLQKGVHDIDVLHWLCGSYTQRVIGMGRLSVYNRCTKHRDSSAYGNAEIEDDNWPPLNQVETNPQMNVEDHNMIMMQLENGVQCSYQQCHYTPDAHRNYTIIGTAGRIENLGDTGTSAIHVHTHRSCFNDEPDEIITLKSSREWHGGADPAIVEEFLQSISGNRQPVISVLDARAAVATADMATQSIRQGNVPYDIPAPSAELLEHFA